MLFWLLVLCITLEIFACKIIDEILGVLELSKVVTANRPSPSCVKLTKSLQQAFNPIIAGTFGSGVWSYSKQPYSNSNCAHTYCGVQPSFLVVQNLVILIGLQLA